MKNIFSYLLFKKRDNNQTKEVLDSYQRTLELSIIEKTITSLKKDPKSFSAIWFTGKSLDASVVNKDNNIQIITSSGQIIKPYKIKMTEEQRNIIKELLKPIEERDKLYLLETLTGDIKTWKS